MEVDKVGTQLLASGDMIWMQCSAAIVGEYTSAGALDVAEGAALDPDDLPGEVGRDVRREVDRDAGDLVRPGEAPVRQVAFQFRP